MDDHHQEKPRIDDLTGRPTMGHDFDGIEELNTPMPRWWLITFYATIIWSIGYTIAYPAWPMISDSTAGLLGYSTRGELAKDVEHFKAQNAEVATQLASADLATLASDDPAYQFGVAGGAAVFRAHCSQCHGAGAAGATGYPNLLDDDWLWGGSIDEVEYTIRHGIRNETDFDAHYSQMTAFGEIFTNEEIAQTTEHVLAISGQEHDATLASAGAELFLDNCASCHGDAGEGMRDLGAPNLTDAVWLYGGDRDAIKHSITYARFGVMPAMGQRLDDVEVKAVALYVHQLGGGE